MAIIDTRRWPRNEKGEPLPAADIAAVLNPPTTDDPCDLMEPQPRKETPA